MKKGIHLLKPDPMSFCLEIWGADALLGPSGGDAGTASQVKEISSSHIDAGEVSSPHIQSVAEGKSRLVCGSQISGSQTWLHTRIPWGTLKTEKHLGSTPDILIQNLHGWGPEICIFRNPDQVVLK